MFKKVIYNKLFVFIIFIILGNNIIGQTLNDPFDIKFHQLLVDKSNPLTQRDKPSFSPKANGDNLNVRLVGHWANNNECYPVATVGDTAYFGNGAYMEIVDFSNPKNPVELGKVPVPVPILDIAIMGTYVYVADGFAGLRVIDIATPSKSREVGFYDTMGSAIGVAVSGTYAYVADYDAGLRVIDIATPGNPREVGFYDTGGMAYGVAVSGTYAYVADCNAGLRVIDIAAPGNPKEESFVTGGRSIRVVVSGTYAYVADYDTGLRVIDIATPGNPNEVCGLYNTGSLLVGVAVSGNYAYVTDYFAGLRIIDIATPGNPKEVGFYDTGGNATMGVAVNGTYAYVTDRWDGLRVVDISTPSAPKEMGFYDTRGFAWDVAMSGSYAYLAEEHTGLRVIDIAIPGDPKEVGFCNTGGTARGVAVSNIYAYLADGDAGLRVIDITTPDAPKEVGFYKTGSHANGVAVSGMYAYLANGLAGFRVIDITSPGNPKEVGFYDTGDHAYGVAVSGTYAYVADGTDGLRVIDIASPGNPKEVGFCGTGNYAYGVAVSGNYAYVTDYFAGLRIIDIATPGNPKEVGFFDTGGSSMDVAVSGTYAFVADDTDGLRVIDIASPGNPKEVGFYDTGGHAYSVAVNGTYAYVADGEDGLYILEFLRQIPPKVWLSSPFNNSFLNIQRPELVWSVSKLEAGWKDILGYKVEVAIDSFFTNHIDSSPFESYIDTTGFRLGPPKTSIESVIYSFQDRLNQGKYYWRVTAWNGKQYGTTSEIFSFSIDIQAPSGTKINSPFISSNKNFNVTWGGGNDGNGSGLSGEYDVIINEDNTEWSIWKKQFMGQNAIFTGKHDHRYSFKALAWDKAGNREDSLKASVTTTYIDTTAVDAQAPSSPIGLMANDANPSPWQQNRTFKIIWYNPFDPSGITRCFYKLGSRPTANNDTTGTYTSLPIPPLMIEATQKYGQPLYAWLEDGRGNRDYRTYDSVLLRYDATPPEVRITFPQAGKRIRDNKIDIKAKMGDRLNYRYNLFYKMAFAEHWQSLHQKSMSLAFDDVIFSWKDIQDSGHVYLKLTAVDLVGNVATDSILFILDNPNYRLPMAIIIEPAINAYVSSWVSIRGTANDEEFDYYTLNLKRENFDTLLIHSKTPVVNKQLHAFDSHKLKDGKYNLFLTVYNQKQYKKTVVTPIIIDNTPPIAQLTSPKSDDTISCFVRILGYADDNNFEKKMTLAYAKTGTIDPSQFITIDTTFTFWNTMGLAGNYTLKLTVEDKAGLTATDQRNYFIDNPQVEVNQDFQIQFEELSLYIPRNGYIPAAICVEKLNVDEIEINRDKYHPTSLVFKIHSSIAENGFIKFGILSFDYNSVDMVYYLENRLKIYHWDDSTWTLIGGSLSEEKRIISPAIKQIGIYGLFEDIQLDPEADKSIELTLICKPRIFSPQGGGYDSKTGISFELGKPTPIAIKIYNASGRFVQDFDGIGTLPYGNHIIHWDGRDESGNFCPSGLYFIVVQAGEKMATATVMVLNKY